MGKLFKCHLKGKTCIKLANGLKFNDLKKKLTLGVALTRSWGYIHVYYHSSQTSLLVMYLRIQVSVYRTIGPLVFLYNMTTMKCAYTVIVKNDTVLNL